MARPTTTTSRSAARAASATARMRATLEAKVVTATRAGARAISSARILATSVSDGERPGGERRGIDRHAQLRPQIEQRAEMVLVRVGQHDTGEIAPLLLEIAHV